MRVGYLTEEKLKEALGDRDTLTKRQFRVLGYYGAFSGWKDEIMCKRWSTQQIAMLVACKDGSISPKGTKKYSQRPPTRHKKKRHPRNKIPEHSSRPLKIQKEKESHREKYKRSLHSKEWIDLSERIKQRDDFKCRSCGKGIKDGARLEVHHLLYEKDKEIWQVPDYYLVTLCHGCHMNEHSRQFIPPPKHFKLEGKRLVKINKGS